LRAASNVGNLRAERARESISGFEAKR